MYDELVKLLRVCGDSNNSCGNCPVRENDGSCPHGEWEFAAEKYMLQAADAIEELLQKTQQLPRWIPVTERLPREGRYLALTTPLLKGDEPYARILRFAERLESVDEYDFRGLNRSGWYYYDNEYGHIEVGTVTHWMPRPKLPKEEE